MEEAWTTRFGTDQSVHLNDFFDVPDHWKSPALIEKWKRIRAFRKVVTGAVEIERAAKRIGSSLEACPVAYFEPTEWRELDGFPARDVAITSEFKLRPLSEAPEGAFRLSEVPNVAVVIEAASGEKCARCWMVLEETRPDTHLCNRCTAVVAALEPA
jgi:isoleucyl-tRNA synthetase